MTMLSAVRTGEIPLTQPASYGRLAASEAFLKRRALKGAVMRVVMFLAAALSGILHGKSPSYLSTLMPNTFSMAPRYVREFAARTGFEPPERDVFDGLDAKAVRRAKSRT